ncbi:MAG TPA: hypothetical protein VEU33_46065 [Archangium sp.]|nr:hypothetical protein [Archangium sp.]
MKLELKGLWLVLALVSVGCGAVIEEQAAVDSQEVGNTEQAVTNGACNTNADAKFCWDSNTYASCAAQSPSYGCAFPNITCASHRGCAPYYICRNLRSGDAYYPSWSSCCDNADQSQSYWVTPTGTGYWYGGSCAAWGVNGP